MAGVVTDPPGAEIPGARVVVTNKETGLKRTFVTAAEGDYSAPALLSLSESRLQRPVAVPQVVWVRP